MALRDTDLAHNFIRYLLTQEVQSYLASGAYEIPMVEGVALPEALPAAAGDNPRPLNSPASRMCADAQVDARSQGAMRRWPLSRYWPHPWRW